MTLSISSRKMRISSWRYIWLSTTPLLSVTREHWTCFSSSPLGVARTIVRMIALRLVDLLYVRGQLDKLLYWIERRMTWLVEMKLKYVTVLSTELQQLYWSTKLYNPININFAEHPWFNLSLDTFLCPSPFYSKWSSPRVSGTFSWGKLSGCEERGEVSRKSCDSQQKLRFCTESRVCLWDWRSCWRLPEIPATIVPGMEFLKVEIINNELLPAH